MKAKALHIAVASIALLITATTFTVSNYLGKYKFTETTGFYFSGLNSTEIGMLQAYGLNNTTDTVCSVYCFEQYRRSEKYIYQDWRFDLRFSYPINSIVVAIPTELSAKIEQVWFKTGTQVTKISGEEFRKLWVEKKSDLITTFRVPYSISGTIGFIKGLRCLWYSQQPIIRKIKYTVSFLVIVLLILIILELKSVISRVFGTSFLWLKHFFTKYNRIFKPVIAFLLGLVFVFFVLEISLRIIGYFHNKTNVEKQINEATQTENTIICAGDSFTESFGSSENNDYPSQLGQIINNNCPTEFAVYNFGRSGKNTSQIAMELPSYITRFKPKVIVILAGSANYWNYWGHEDESFWASLKTVKLFKLLIKNVHYQSNKNNFNKEEYLKNRLNFQFTVNAPELLNPPLIVMLKSHNTDSIIQYIDTDALNENDIFNIILYSVIAEKPEIATKCLNKVQPKTERVQFYTDFFKEISTDEKMEIGSYPESYQAIYYYLKELLNACFTEKGMQLCIKKNKYFEDAYFELNNLGFDKLEIPSDYNEKRFSIRDSLYYYSVLYGFEKRNQAYIVENLDGDMKANEIDEWVAHDISKMIELCQQSGIGVVIMNYPMLHKGTLFYSVNEILRQTAKKYQIPFVDNELIFDTIKHDPSSYYISDGHCSDKGYNLIARNLYKVLYESKLLIRKTGADAK